MTETAPRTAAPLVVLHGYSSGPESAAGLADAVDPHGDRHHLCPAGPCSVEGGRSWFDPADVGRSAFVEVIGKDGISRYGVIEQVDQTRGIAIVKLRTG